MGFTPIVIVLAKPFQCMIFPRWVRALSSIKVKALNCSKHNSTSIIYLFNEISERSSIVAASHLKSTSIDLMRKVPWPCLLVGTLLFLDLPSAVQLFHSYT